MKAVLITVGIILMIGGIFSLATGGFSFTHEKKDVDAGPIQISHDSTKHVPIAPIVSVIALIGGGFLVFLGSKNR